jgi:pimeloyl-ACP methyl ester carboxylesterase
MLSQSGEIVAMPRLRTVLLAILGLLVLGGLATWIGFDADMRAARAALADRSEVASTAAGAIEYADVGEGPPLLTIHGAGGGFDQGLDNAAAMIGPGFRLIAPSRFGYLRTPIPADASPAAQADAHLALLDRLGIGRVVVLGVSAGTRSALELALRHPERVAALILVVPATYYPDMIKLEQQRAADFPVMLWLVNNGADLAWWTLEHVAPDALIRFVGVPPQVVHAASAQDQAAVMRLVRSIEPLSERFAGINIDSQPDLAPRPLETLKVPTLLVTARDDLFNTHPSAEYAASRIPGAKLVVFDQGGHLLVGHGDEVRQTVGAFLAGLNLAPDLAQTHRGATIPGAS